MKRDGATAAHHAHNVEVEGSTPSPAMKRYQRVGVGTRIGSLLLTNQYGAFHAAQKYYAEKLKGNFAESLVEYLEDGFIVSRPHLFGMFKPIEYNGRRGWFIEFAVGNILELLTCFPCALEFVAFCRDGGDMRVVEWNYFISKAIKMNERKVA